jgi:hypothetical protein
VDLAALLGVKPASGRGTMKVLARIRFRYCTVEAVEFPLEKNGQLRAWLDISRRKLMKRNRW